MNAVLIALALLAYTGAILTFKQGTAYINSHVLGAIVNFLATIVPAAIFVLFQSQRDFPNASHTKGYLWALFGGACIGVFTIAMTKLFSSGENVSFVTPLVYGGSVFLASLIGVVFYSEKVSILQSSGLLFTVAGIVLISIATYQGGRS